MDTYLKRQENDLLYLCRKYHKVIIVTYTYNNNNNNNGVAYSYNQQATVWMTKDSRFYFLQGKGIFASLQSPDRLWGTPAFCQMRIRDSFSG
jgi:hypothetical protein